MEIDVITRARAMVAEGKAPTLDNVPCVCGGSRELHSGSARMGGSLATNCRRYRADQAAQWAAGAAAATDATFLDEMREYEKLTRKGMRKAKGEISVRPSDVGGCRRAVYYRELPPEGFVRDPESKGPAVMGGIIHDEVMRRRAVLYPWRMFGDLRGMEVYLRGFDRPYRYDEYDPITCRLISWKTAGDWQWGKVGERGADDKWWDQDHLYAAALIDCGYPVVDIEVRVLHREKGKDERFVEPYDPQRAVDVLDRQLILLSYLEAVRDLGIEPPPRDRSGPSTDGLCRNCFARSTCWNIPQAQAAGRSPENYTLVDNEDDANIESIALDLIAARAAESKAKAEKDQLSALLDGARTAPYVYGSVEGVPGGQSRPDYKSAFERAREMWTMPEDQRPAFLPDPIVNRSEHVTWKLLRQATRNRIEKERKAREAASAVDLTEATPVSA